MGHGWLDAVHPGDIDPLMEIWKTSVETGRPFQFEYRLRRKDGAYRWMLARAAPLINTATGTASQWFGTTTDIHDGIESKNEAKRMREQLLSVLTHAHVTIFVTGRSHKLTMLEGELTQELAMANSSKASSDKWYIGQDVFDVFRHLDPSIAFQEPIEEVFTGKRKRDYVEHGIRMP